MQTIVDEDLVENAARVGAVLLRELRELQEKYEFIGDVRGTGLLIGIDLVKDRRTKEPLPQPRSPRRSSSARCAAGCCSWATSRACGSIRRSC